MIKKASTEVPATTFEEIGLMPELLKALEEINFTTPTPIQAKTIPHLLESKGDLIALAQTGTGKTAAFSLPIIQKIERGQSNVQALVLCPTRELCLQITNDVNSFLKYVDGVSVTAVYGGEGMERQIRALKKGVQIVIGTPGRVNDMIRRKVLKLEKINTLVLDEADEMLNMGFKEELDEILAQTPGTQQTLLFSATMPKSIASIAHKYMKKPQEISAGTPNAAANKVEHQFYVVHARDKYAALRRILDFHPDIYGIVFCRTRNETAEITDKLIQDHYSAEAIHGDLSQSQRTDVMNRFRKKQTKILAATDVAARGIDVRDLTHIINFSLPDSSETYIHRSGRTGRADKSGISICIINMKETHKVRFIERKTNKAFQHKQIPSGEEICGKQLLNLIERIKNVEVNEAQIAQYLPIINEKLESLSREELIKKFVSIEFNRFLSFYKDAPNLNVSGSHASGGRQGDRSWDGDRRERHGSTNAVRLQISVGRRDGFTVKDLFAVFNKQPRLKQVEIGQIDLFNDFSVFEVSPGDEREVIEHFGTLSFHGKPVSINRDSGPRSSSQGRPARPSYNRSRSSSDRGPRRNNDRPPRGRR